MPTTDTPDPRVFDLWVALLAGERIWHDGPIQPSPRERISAGIALLGTVGTVSVIWVAIPARFDLWRFEAIDARRAWMLVLATTATLAALMLFLRYQRILRGHEAVGRPFWFEVTWRSAAFLLLTAAFAAALPRGHISGVFPVGILAGADASLTLWALGVAPRTRTWAWRFLVSPVHFGAVGALLAVAAFGESFPALRTLASLYGALWVGLLVAGLTVASINRLAAAVDDRVAEENHDMLVSERARRAHWLHDDVLSEVHLASLRISSGSATPDEINAELRDLDHRLRLRQLDDMMSAGAPRVYEILQPHLRRIQNLGVRLDSVPSHDVTRIEVEQECGMLLNRAVSLLTSNAVNAGATRLAIGLQLVDGATRLRLTVIDDAGGFDLAAVPDGRGLSTLMDQLGPGAVQRYDAPCGSMMVVTLSCAHRSATKPPRHRGVPASGHQPGRHDVDQHRHEHHGQLDHQHPREINR
jgi:signal transduction histidine kinase